MNTQATCPRCDKRVNGQWKVCGYCGYRLCNADHCTPEERAVIEAALELSKGFFRAGDSIWRGPLYSNEAEDRFVTAAWQLLAARAGREKE